MPLYVRDERMNQLAEKAQKILKAPTKDAIRQALERVVEEHEKKLLVAERLGRIRQRYRNIGALLRR